MGAGASMENEEGGGGGQRPPTGRSGGSRPGSRPGSQPGSGRTTPTGRYPSSRRGSITSMATLRSAFKSAKVPPSGLRKMRAAALGRKTACQVSIDKTGFSLQHIRICEGQTVGFEWTTPEGGQGFNVTQVVHDGEQYRPVIGGFNSGPLSKDGFFEQQFNLVGEYKFVSAGIRCTPLRVEVYPRKDVEGECSDEGFSPKIIRIDEGNSINWHWTGCSIAHTVTEVKFSHKTGTLVTKESSDKPIPTKAGSWRKDFMKPGIFYYQTEGSTQGVMHTCVVHVRERQREYRVDVLDRSFAPPILVVQEGDRVWWNWDKEKCQNYHCVYQIEPPPLSAPADESYKPYKNGFKWPNPSRCGLLSFEFYEAGVYFYSDHNFKEAAEYVGTIIVKPKQVEHFIEINQEGFTEDLVYAETGDRVWWAWKADEVSAPMIINEVDKCVSPIASRPMLEDDSAGGEGSYMDEALEYLKVQVELDSVQLGSIGCYHYKLSDAANNMSTCSIVVQGGPRNHTVHVTDSGFEPKVVTIHPGDRVWWVWQDGKKQHNIIQVSHQGNPIKSGFGSGAPSDPPSAFLNQFHTPGVYYYISNGIAKAFGAVVVSSQPKVHEVQVTGAGIQPDPVVIAANDVIAWTFKGLRQHDVIEVATVDQLLDSQMHSPTIIPRRCLSRLFTEHGVHHFTSKSFLRQGKSNQARQNDETRLSSIIVDEMTDSSIIRVNSHGFHPSTINVKKGQSVLWTWKESGDEAHNIINVNPPDSDKPLSVIQGGKSFNSGRPVPRNSFLYTFDEPGTYSVASQGAPGFAGNISVLPDAEQAIVPRIISEQNGGTVEKNYVVELDTDTEGSTIYYTLDGTAPELHKVMAKQYKAEKGIVLKSSGLCFVRAMASIDDALNSAIYTSKRFWVLSGESDAASEMSVDPDPQQDEAGMTQMWQWWSCVPVIKGSFVGGPGQMEIFWDPPPPEALGIIKGYQMYLNGVSYRPMLPPHHHSLNIAGLAGGRMYEVVLEASPIDTMYLPHKSNKLVMKCPKTTSTGGPMISLETTAKPDMLAIVWMAISTPENPIQGYRVYLNGQMCGNQVVPDENSDRCKVVIEGCAIGSIYKIVVAAIPIHASSPKRSNELEVTLPLDVAHIVLPPSDVRLDDEDLYREYVEVQEGSGYVAGGSGRKQKKRRSKTAVVEVQEGAHLTIEKQETKTVVMQPAVPIVGAQDGQEQLLPPPIVSAENRGADEVLVKWHFNKDAGPMYRLVVNVVNVVGAKFKKVVNSNISFECLQQENNEAVAAIQHQWNVTSSPQCLVEGLTPGMTYSIFVVANYALVNSQQPAELQSKSVVIKYTTLGPPPPPVLKPYATDLYQVTVEWESQEAHRDVSITGYQVLVDNKPLGNILSKTTRKTTIDNLQPGRTIAVSVVACTNHAVGNSEASNVIRITCPARPPPAVINQQPSYKKGCVIIGWEKPQAADHVPYGEDIIFYRIYLDGSWHGEVKSNSTCNRNGYQYYLTDLQSGQSYDVQIRSYCGQRKVDPGSDQVFGISESEMSNSMPVMCPAPPNSPCLRLDGMHSEGIDITWEMPQQFGDAAVSGYQLLKDGKLYGSIMPPEVHSLRIKDVSLGDRIQLQILALTDHPVGRSDENKSRSTADGDSGLESSHAAEKGLSEIFIGDRYSACEPGPKLVVHYTGLVQPPVKVWCERVTGHSAMIVWEKNTNIRAHFVEAESFQVTWWPKGSNADINSQATKDDHLLITGLKPNMTYNVAVEARRLQSYADIQEGEVPDDGYNHTFILTGQSEHLTMKTARPPGAPTNLGIIATTTHSIQIAWDPPHESGIEIVAVRVDAVPMKSSEQTRHIATEVLADSTSTVIDNLNEKSEYMLTVTAITEEFFEQLPEGHDWRRTRSLGLNKPPPEDPWLPSSSMIAMTSGTDAPSDIRIIDTSINSVTICWSAPVVFGSNRLQGTVVRWAEGKFTKLGNNDANLAHHKSIVADANEAQIDDLHPGILYKIVVEAVISVKTAIEADRKDPEYEKKNRRTTHVMSKPIFVRTRAPCEPPKPFITGYTSSTIQLYWEKPLLYSVVGNDENGNPKYLKLSLEGYRLEINGKPHMRLVSNAQSCTLVKCRPGKAYKIVLVALTCTEEVKKERKRKLRMQNGLNTSTSSMTTSVNQEWETTTEDMENDESLSQPIECVLPMSHEGMLSELSASFKLPSSGGFSDDYCGDLQVEWTMQGHPEVKQYDVTWHCEADGNMQKKVVNPNVNHCTIPVSKRKCVYDVRVEPQYKSDTTHDPQKVQVLSPGPPDSPVIFTKAIGKDEFIIEWGEPRLWGVRVDGYQVYLNGKKVGSPLSNTHRKAVIPCKSKRTYKVSLTAISGDPNVGDSGQSNTLIITTGLTDGVRFAAGTSQVGPPMEDDVQMEDDSDLFVKVTKVTENDIHVDWVTYAEPEGMLYYRVTWSSAVQPADREVKLPAGEKSCVLHKCYPGSHHFLRVFAVGKEDRVLDVSRQLTVQTSAPPDTPIVTQRACNFRYIAIEWERPKTYGDAKVSGYKVFVNGVVEAQLGPDQQTFSYAQGRWCREYAFQVQALTANEKLNSKPSDPLVVTWPGVQVPVLRRAPALSSNAIKVTWDRPNVTDGVKVKHFKVVCMDEETERPVQVVAPIHVDTHEAEIHNLKSGSYLVFLEVHIHGSNDVIRSDALKIQPTITPDPPQISVTVIGLEERRQIEKVSCDLINKRDRLLNFLNNKDMLSTMRIVDEDQVIGKVTEDLTHVEDMLDDCLSSITHYTGHLLAHVSWTCPQSNPEIRVSGYKVLVDSKQYGTTLHSGVKNVRIKLGLVQQSHMLSMVAVSDHPHTTSTQSNVIELLTEPFQPFTFFMFLENKNPKVGLSYLDVLAQERKSSRGLVNQGLMRRHVPPPACALMDIFEGEYRPLFPPSGPVRPTAVFFWAKWNVASKRALGWFFRYAKSCNFHYDFIAVACQREEVSSMERQEMVHIITENGWRDDKRVRYFTSHTAAPVADVAGTMYNDAADLFGIVGTPMLAVVHPEDYIAWKGRFCAFEYSSFENFMKFVFAQALGEIPTISDPWDTAIDVDALDGVSKQRLSESQMLIHRPQHVNMRASLGSTSTHQFNGLRPNSSKKKFFTQVNQQKLGKKENRISVNQRPFSAGSNSSGKSPYAQKLVGSNGTPPRRVKSGKKLKGAY